MGCGALEDLIALHGEKMLPVILAAATANSILRFELSAIYETSVSPDAWKRIQAVLKR
jgi:hypothetical protein